MPKSTWLSYLGIAKEGTAGTATAPTAFIPVTSFKPADDLKYLEDKGYRGSMVETYNLIPGMQTSSYEFGANVDLATVGFPIASILSDVTVSGSAAPYTTTFAALNNSNPDPTYTITDYSAVETRQNPGCMFTEVGFKFSGTDLFTYDAKAVGLKSVVGTTPTPSWGTNVPPAGWTGVIKIGGTAISTVQEGSFTIKQPVNPLAAVGSQSPYSMWAGLTSVEGSLNFIMEDTSQLANYLNNTQPSLDITYTQGTQSINLHCSKAAYTAATKDRSKDYLELQVNFTALSNTTDVGASGGYSPCKVTLVGAAPAGTYR